MNKLLYFILCLAICLSLLSCSDANTDIKETSTSNNISQQGTSGSQSNLQKDETENKKYLLDLIDQEPFYSVSTYELVDKIREYDIIYNAASIQKTLDYFQNLELKETTPPPGLPFPTVAFSINYNDGDRIIISYYEGYENKLQVSRLKKGAYESDRLGYYMLVDESDISPIKFCEALDPVKKFDPSVEFLKSFDSVNIYLPEKLKVSSNLKNEVVKIYFCDPNIYFPYTHSILSTTGRSRNAYMVVNEDGAVSYTTLSSDEFVYEEEWYGTAKVYDLKEKGYNHFKYALHPELVFDDSVEVYYTFALVEHLGYYPYSFWIYYSTSKGDYILYDGDRINYGKYLIPLKDFCEIMDDVYAYGKEIGSLATVTIHDVRGSDELAPYLFEEQ